MRHSGRFAVGCLAAMVVAWPAVASTITGAVVGPDGKPFMGAFVSATDPQSRMSVDVLSNAQGRYRLPNLRAGAWTLSIVAIGYAAPAVDKFALAESETKSFDFALSKVPVQWSDLSTWQGRMLLPKTPAHDLSHKDPFFLTCLESCHSFENKMAKSKLNEADWGSMVDYMRTVMLPISNGHLTDEQARDYASYLTTAFGPQSPKPASPQDAPGYAATLRPFSPNAMNIVYVEYPIPTPAGIGPWSGAPDKNDLIWIPYYGRGNAVIRLDPASGATKSFPLASTITQAAGIHSAVPAPDGTVWFSELGLGRIGHLFPQTGQIVEYQNSNLDDGRRTTAHTVRVDDSGRIWASGGPAITMFDPKTEKFKHFDVAGTYGVAAGLNGDEWFTQFHVDGAIVRITKDGALTKFDPPTHGKPQRLAVDSDGVVWFTERQGNKIGRLDPKTGAFQEFPLPGPEASPYAIGVDRDHMIWYSSHEQDTLGRLDPKTGQVTEYPFPHSEISMRELFSDSYGRIWYASSVNNTVGYFYLDKSGGS